MNKTDDQLREEISSNETRGEAGAWLIIIGLAVEVILAGALPHGDYPTVEKWSPVFANAFIGLGVYLEVHFGRKGSRSAKELQTRTEAKLAEAISDLAKLKRPRRLSDFQKAQILEKLTPYKGTPMMVSTIAGEPVKLAMDIGDALTAAGFVWVNWGTGPVPAVVHSFPGRPIVGTVPVEGIDIEITDEELVPAAHALVSILQSSGWEGVATGMIPATGAPPEMRKMMIVMVGNKP